MSRSIHMTAKKLVRQNSKAELCDPTNPDLLEYAEKFRLKKEAKQVRQAKKIGMDEGSLDTKRNTMDKSVLAKPCR